MENTKFQIGQLVMVRNSVIKKPGRILDINYRHAIVAWKVKNNRLNLLTTRKVRLHNLEIYQLPKKSFLHGIISLFGISPKTK